MHISAKTTASCLLPTVTILHPTESFPMLLVFASDTLEIGYDSRRYNGFDIIVTYETFPEMF